MSKLPHTVELSEESLSAIMGGCECDDDDEWITAFELDDDFAGEFDCGSASDTGVCWIA